MYKQFYEGIYFYQSNFHFTTNSYLFNVIKSPGKNPIQWENWFFLFIKSKIHKGFVNVTLLIISDYIAISLHEAFSLLFSTSCDLDTWKSEGNLKIKPEIASATTNQIIVSSYVLRIFVCFRLHPYPIHIEQLTKMYFDVYTNHQ